MNTNTNTNTIEELIDKYNEFDKPDKLLELEIRKNITPDMYDLFMKLYESYDVDIDISINYLTPIKNGYISYNSVTNKSHIKRRIAKYGSYATDGYIISVAFETVEHKSNININSDFSRIREKARKSIKISDKWIMDLTIVNNEKFEIELEYINSIDPNKLITIDDILFGINYIMNVFENNLSMQSKHMYDAKHDNELNRDDILSYVEELINYRDKKSVKTIKTILPSVTGLTRYHYMTQIFPPIGYYYTTKTDGKRSIMLISTDKIYIVNDELIIKNNTNKINMTILDGEYVPEDDIFYAFDIIVYNGQNVSGKVLDERFKFLHLLHDISNNLKIKNIKRIDKLTDIKYKEFNRYKNKIEQEYGLINLLSSTNSKSWEQLVGEAIGKNINNINRLKNIEGTIYHMLGEKISNWIS